MGKRFTNHTIRKLDPKGVVDRKTGVKDLELESFFLSLALIFNDIKGIALIERDFLKKYEKPEPNKISGHAGEWAGIKLQIVKYSASILHEALNLIEKKKKLLSSQRFERYYNFLNAYDKNIWFLILNVCDIKQSVNLNKKKIKLFRKLLLLIRNSISFHYDDSGKPLIRGYRNHFYSNRITPNNESAMYSFKKSNFFTTRFYYADAALSGFLNQLTESQFGNSKVFVEEMNRMVLEIAKVIMGLLEAYHQDIKNN